MFSPELLLNDLRKQGGYLVAKCLSDIVLTNFALYKGIGDLKTAVFFLQLNHLFKVYVEYSKVQSNPIFLDTQAEIERPP